METINMNEPKNISIGIDPGRSSGAIAIIIDGELVIHKMDKLTEQEMDEIIKDARYKKGMETILNASIEKVGSMPDQGIASAFKFGMNYGYMRGILVANRIPFTEPHPRKWQKLYSMSKNKGESKTDWKRRLLEVAQNLYPSSKIFVYAADAVLLAHYAKNINQID